MIDGALFKRGMRRLAAGVSIVTTIEQGARYGMVATSVSSVCAEPEPSLLVCVHRDSSSQDVIRRTGVFCANVLGAGDIELAQRFSSKVSHAKRFEQGSWVPLVTGAPALTSALVSFDCEITHVMPVHSHTIFVGAVRDLRIWQNEIDALVYIDGRYLTGAESAACMS
jgi:flavin reductase